MQVHHEFAHASRGCFHGGSSNLSESSANRLAEPPSFFRPLSLQRFYPWTPRISDEPYHDDPRIHTATLCSAESSPLLMRLRMSAMMPKVQSGAASDVVTLLIKEPSAGVEMVTTSP